MRGKNLLGAGATAVALGAIVALACSSSSPRYPACERDDQCAVKGKHDYCVSGTCVYCRTSVDCGERERCRAGKCEVDPDQPPPTDDAGPDASDGGDEDADSDNPDDSHGARPVPHVIPRGVRRFLRP